MKPFEGFLSGSLTDIGQRRSRNEDAVLEIPEHGVYAVADGMGGGHAGDIASRAVLKYIQEAVVGAFQHRETPPDLAETVQIVCDATNQSSQWIFDLTASMGQRVMGTTMLTIIFDPMDRTRACLLHAGDSRAYAARSNGLICLTEDHSAARAVGIHNDEDIPLQLRGIITRAVGVRSDVQIEHTQVSLRPGDIFLLCTDGLYNMLDADVIRSVAMRTSSPVEERVQELVRLANEAGGFDNISVVLVQLPG